MRLATIRTGTCTRAVRVDADRAVETGHTDVGAVLAEHDWRAVTASAAGREHDLTAVEYAPVIPEPGKVFCVGLNYRNHILEMGRDLPQYPTLFTKFADALIGAGDDIVLPPESTAVDWEAELAIVVGSPVRRADETEAAAAIAGFTVLNDVTMRDWQYRTSEWTQGKTFEAATPVGPVLVTPNELPGGVRPTLPLSCVVDGETVQKADTSDLVFDPVALVRYISTIITLWPGDVIATGTPGGVGHARKPPRYLADGTLVVTEIGGIGRLRNRARSER
jgi:acylpyruvate hydrolase